MTEIVIIGGGGHAKVVVSILRKLKDYEICGYTDLEDRGPLLGAPYLGTDAKLPALANEKKGLSAALAVGQIGLGAVRQAIHARLSELPLSYPSIVSPHAIVNEEVEIGEGCVVMDGAVVNSGARIGRGAILNSNCTVEHDTQIGDWVHVAPGVTISGGVTVGPLSMIGVGAVIIEGKRIANGCIIGAGAVVVHDLTEPGVYVGCPARRIR
jgi:sugar O-acyltransferase (sialic acid O-acetyltransferase NeuD family)